VKTNIKLLLMSRNYLMWNGNERKEFKEKSDA
jgi:hypothetical protein